MNVNIGIMGHVDSGKTSLARMISVGSTASFDKLPQSRERGITLDLGFSYTEFKQSAEGPAVQATFVDCPGHASLIQCIIGGSQIMDLIILVVDAVKGIQSQTTESVILAELTVKSIIVVINKIDLLDENQISKCTSVLRKALRTTKFPNAPVIAVSTISGQGIDKLLRTIHKEIKVQNRSSEGDFIFAVDHCFSLKGKGTILTGTCLQGNIGINEKISVLGKITESKIRSIQIFKQPVDRIHQGDRAAICTSGLDPRGIERCLVCSPGAVSAKNRVFILASKVRHFSAAIQSQSRFSFVVGYETVHGTCLFLSKESSDYRIVDFSSQQSLCYIILDRSMYIHKETLIVALRDKGCRIVFSGKQITEIPSRAFREKEKRGIVERINKENEIICKELLNKNNLPSFIGYKVEVRNEQGTIIGPFGQSGRCKITIKTDSLRVGDSVVMKIRKYQCLDVPG